MNSHGLICLDSGETSRAIRLLHRAIKLDPNLAAAHANLGHALAQTEQTEAAKTSYLKALSINPTLSDALVNLALLLRHHGEIREIEAVIPSVSKGDTSDPGILFVRGLLYLDEDRLHDAEKAFRRGLKSSPNSVPLLVNLGVTLARQGRTEWALEAYTEA